jgi:glutamine amidotransferase
MIGILDYGSGNVRAFANVYKTLDIPARIVRRVEDLDGVEKVILPGVGDFDYAMQKLDASGMRPALEDLVSSQHMPILGVCVGMQMLGQSSEEGSLAGLAWLDGAVKRFDPKLLNTAVDVPHMGWNNVAPVKESGLLRGLDSDSRFYFLHSYYFQTNNTADVIAVTDYGGPFACAISSDNVFGVQFHPEKSHRWGIRLLENFAKL